MQRSFDDLGTPLSDVTFVVLDLETTGGSPASCAITEIGAIKFRGGECLGTFQTLVNPGVPIPPEIVYLTGITETMVGPAPRIEAVLPAFVEFIGDGIVVGHNVRFDLRFLQANLDRLGYRRLRNRFVDTCSLARRLVRDEVPNCKLATLARHFRTVADPCHRALDDAKATAEVLHALLERVGRMGVTALDDLLALPSTAAHPQVAKLSWVASLPRRPGVYLFRDGSGRVLYVGRATDLRRRVRSYFSSDDRRKIGPLLREAQSLDHIVCTNELEAGVLEVRLIHEHAPRFNRQVKLWKKYVYLKLTLAERFPRLSVVRAARPGDGCLYLGPIASSAMAKAAAEAVESVLPLRRCTARPSPTAPRPAPCTPAQLGVATCPCAGAIGEAAYREIAEKAAAAMTTSPLLVVEPLVSKMRALAAAHRFEEAAAVRERANAFARIVARQHRLEALVTAGRIEVEFDGGRTELSGGRFVRSWRELAQDRDAPMLALPMAQPIAGGLPIALHDVDEVAWIASWLESRARSVRLVHADTGLSFPTVRLPRLEPAPQAGARGSLVRAVA